MNRLWLASMALLTTLPPALAAQQREAEPARERDRVEVRPRVEALRRTEGREFMRLMSRPRIGVALSTEPNTETDKIGARVLEVTPNGPAADAGLREGDIITRFGDTRLAGDGPSQKLIELAQKLEAGDTVKVEYRRNGARRNATIVAEEMGMGNLASTMPRMVIEREFERMMPALEGIRNNVTMFLGGWPGLELVGLNPGLGEYFGTSEGVLVISAPTDSTLPLRAGDVVTRIDGRTPRSVAHALRILGSYAGGEKVNFEVMRKQQRQTLSWTVAERRDAYQFKGMHREPLERPTVKLRETRPGA